MAMRLIAQEAHVLDVGCGDGSFLELLMKEKNCTGLGLDISPEMVHEARERGVRAEVTDLDRDEFSIGKRRFDYVCALEVLEHLHHPISLLREITKISKYGIFSCFNACWWRYRFSILQGKIPAGWELGRHLWQWSYSDYKNILEYGGWTLKQVEIIPGTPVVGYLSKTLSKSVAWLRPNLFIYGYTFLCES